MKIETTSIVDQLKKVSRFVVRYKAVISIVAIVALYGWLVWQINVLGQREPTQQAVDEKLQTIKQPKIDKATIEKIQQLEDNSVEVQALFKQARENPFQE